MKMFQANPRIFANANSALSMLSNPEVNILRSAGIRNPCRCPRQTIPSDIEDSTILVLDARSNHDHEDRVNYQQDIAPSVQRTAYMKL